MFDGRGREEARLCLSISKTLALDFVTTIVVAAGSGSRFGAKKQFLELLPGKTMLDLSVETASRISTEVIVVVPADSVDTMRVRYQGTKVVMGGNSRSESVRMALPFVDRDCRWVLIHDGARPLASESLFIRVIERLRNGARAVVPAIAVSDTIKRVEEAVVTETLNRETLRRVQTPQGFEFRDLLIAYRGDLEGTDDASLFECLDIDVEVVDGDEDNIKVTNRSDVDVIKSLLSRRGEEGESVSDSVKYRVGSGFDIHPFAKDESRVLTIGGVVLPGCGLAGHSDADVLCHAIADAVLGAAGLSDIGEHFSDKDPRWKNSNSVEILKTCIAMARRKGYLVEHVDSTVVCESPRLSPYRNAIVKSLEDAVGAEVNVKAKTAERLGSIGRNEAIAAFATVLMKGAVR